MRLVHHQPIHAELFKGDDIIFLFLRFQLFKPRLKLLFRAFQLLDGKPLAVGIFDLRNAVCDFRNLIADDSLLPFPADGDSLRLTLPDNHRVISAGCDARAKALPPSFLKIALGCHQNVGVGIQPKKLRSPLFGQMIGDNDHAFRA